MITAPANDHRAFRLVCRLIQTIKRRLGCMSKSNRFTIKSLVYQLRICKQKANNIAKFGTKAERNIFLWKFVQSNSKSKRFTNSKVYQLRIC